MKEGKKWENGDETAALLLSDPKPEMKGQNWQQLEDYPTLLLTLTAESYFKIHGYLWLVLHTAMWLTDEEQVHELVQQLLLVLTNSQATTQLSTTATSETVLPDINISLTHTYSIFFFITGGRILVMVFITIFCISILFYC